MKNRVIIISLIALAFTVVSPFIFNAYIEDKPEELEQSLVFGGPFPFAEQSLKVPESPFSYPAIIEFESPLDESTTIKWIPMLLTFTCFFLLFFSFYSIVARFITGKPKKTEEEKPE
ncbi:hypothetical protein [Cytobacillus purgationiresistens]|uniref:Uncharacterized protein n=1 Tax=Cytobacillus purgationiresistens TaxID=863449 RepID=A0ABU0ANU1_9BACI|nr:hypothetical protein [Cytobacillus purgationiresistens]MDQ0272437.1 hypothetical protein [Cytobacillus purgationiresistens]